MTSRKNGSAPNPLSRLSIGFFSIHDPSRRENSVYRLYHLMALSDHEYLRLKAIDKTTVFDESMVDFWLRRGSESKEADSIARRDIYRRVLEHIDDPQDLVHALDHFELPEFVQSVYEKLGMKMTKRELGLIWDDSW